MQSYDPRNAQIKIFIGDQLYDRDEAKISVFDSSVQGGDAVWEGIRLYESGLFLLDRHLDRLRASAIAMAFYRIPTIEFVRKGLQKTLEANKMVSDVHIRLTLTRGKKITSGMDPRLNQDGPCLIILAEWKPPIYRDKNSIQVITSSIRRNSPNHVDSKIHHNNLINNILAKIQANVAGVDSALMLDVHGFVSELNGTNVFMIKNREVFTPHADACLPGITRDMVMRLCRDLGVKIYEKNISLTELYTADEVFCTGSMGELTTIGIIDGRIIQESASSIFSEIRSAFARAIPQYCTAIKDL